jgi:hypothetical protein
MMCFFPVLAPCFGASDAFGEHHVRLLVAGTNPHRRLIHPSPSSVCLTRAIAGQYLAAWRDGCRFIFQETRNGLGLA